MLWKLCNARVIVRAIFRASLDARPRRAETTSTSAAFAIQLWIICAPGRPAWHCTERADVCPAARGQTVTRGANLSCDSSLFPSYGLVSPSFSQRTITSIRSLPLLSHASDDASPSPRSTSGLLELQCRAERWTQTGGESEAGDLAQ